MKLVIDRFEGKYAICEDADRNYFAIELPELPEGAKEGSVIIAPEEGGFFLDLEETARRRERIAEKQRRIFGK